MCQLLKSSFLLFAAGRNDVSYLYNSGTDFLRIFLWSFFQLIENFRLQNRLLSLIHQEL